MSGQVYAWKPKSGIAVDPQVAGEAVETLQQRLAGPVTPADLLDHAKGNNSGLHGAFEWDDTLAAEAHRLQQAGHLLRSLVVTVKVRETEPQRTMRAFVNVTTKATAEKPEAKRGYVGLAVAMDDADMRQQVVAQAWRELHAWRERYREYAELADLMAEIDKIEAEKKAG